MKLGICAIAKCENDYIEEWVNHYIDNVGADCIYLYDNNDFDYEDVSTRIIKHRDKVVITKWDKTQPQAYNDCRLKHWKECDWLGVFDIDEFLVLDDGIKIKELLQKEPYCNATSVRVTWCMYDDNDLIYRDITVPVMESFTRFNTQWVQSKTLYHCAIRSGEMRLVSHGDTGEDGKMLDICGEVCYSGVPETNMYQTKHIIPNKNPPYLQVGRLNHYRCKSLSEYIKKAKMNTSGLNYNAFSDSDKVIHYYFSTMNKVTQEKINMFIENGFIPSEECMKYLMNRLTR